jgi:hypothetical protein
MKTMKFLICTVLVSTMCTDTEPAVAISPAVPNASPEAKSLLNYLYDLSGKKTLSGQMWAPWGNFDEIEKIKEITGKYPALRGHDLIHDRDNANEIRLLIEWWKKGGIPTLMWHWGAPGKGEGYEQSKMKIDIERCFEDGTVENKAMWADLKRIADWLTALRDAGVPVLWRPMHEFEGGWFWYGKGSGEQFNRLWRTMFNYFTRERNLNNLIWVLCHSDFPNPEFNPGNGYYDLAGADTYRPDGIQERMFKEVVAVHGNLAPVPFHECGTVPDPAECFEKGVTWSWWMLWHTNHVVRHDPEALSRIYNHDLVITLDEVPDIMQVYGKD